MHYALRFGLYAFLCALYLHSFLTERVGILPPLLLVPLAVAFAALALRAATRAVRAVWHEGQSPRHPTPDAP